MLCIWLLKQYSIQALWKMMLGMRPLWILAALGLMVVYWVFESLGLHLAVSRFVPTQNPGDTFCATMIGQFFNCITPFSSGCQPMQGVVLGEKRSVPLLCQLFLVNQIYCISVCVDHLFSVDTIAVL